METSKDRRVLLTLGAALALLAGLGVAVMIAVNGAGEAAPPPASVGGLVVETSHPTQQKLDPAQPLRCYVGGQLIGQMTVADCAKRNGVATGALNVGLDAAPAAPPAPVAAPPTPPPFDPAGSGEPSLAQSDIAPPAAGPRPCWGYDSGAWRRAPQDMGLAACVQALFSGQCVGPAGAVFGRWGDRTLRLSAGRVEIDAGGGAFRTLTRQAAGCVIPEPGQGQ